MLLSESVGRRQSPPIESYVATDPAARLASTARDRHLCLTGFAFGTDYALTLKAGLPGAVQALAADWRLRFSVPNRPPEFDFARPGRIVPRLSAQTIELRSVNMSRLWVELFHVADRDLVQLLDPSRPDGVRASDRAEPVWQGALDVKLDPNRETSTPIPIEKTVGALQPGIYAAVARPIDRAPDASAQTSTTGYFVVSDLGLLAYRTAGGLTVAVRSLATAAAAAGVDVALIGANNRELARIRTDGSGYSRFDPAVLKGTGGDRPRAVFAYGAAGELSWLDLDSAAHGTETEASPSSSLRALVLPQRSDYRPGDEARMTILARDAQARAPAKMPLTIKISRPDGAPYDVRTIDEAGAGGYSLSFLLPPNGNDGIWRIRVFADPNDPPIGDSIIEVGDAQSPRLALSPAIESAVIDPAQPGSVDIRAQYAFGPPASFVPGELDVAVGPASNPFPAFADFAFGLADEQTAAITADPVHFTTDAAGKASQALRIAAQPSATRPIEARIVAKLLDLDGRPIERSTGAPIANQPLSLGLKPVGGPDFPEGQPVHFEAIAVGPDGARLEKPDAGWEIHRLEPVSDWSWTGGRWVAGRTIRATGVAGGVTAISATAPAAIDFSLPAGTYEMEIFDPRSEAASSLPFRVGLSDGPTAAIELKPPKPLFAPGEGADILVKPPFDSDVLLAAADRTLRTTEVQHVPAAGATMHVDIPRDAAGGLELAATAIAPGSASPSGLPRRATGFGRLQLDRTGQRLDVKLEFPEKAQPEQDLPISIAVSGAGDEPAFVVVSAVDEAALPPIGLESSDPLDFFLPVRAAGVTMVELLGGEPESGLATGDVTTFDVSRANADGPAPTRPLALYSGIVALDKTSKAVVSLPIPEFAGKLRVTAIAWSASRLGQATAQTMVRRPLAATLTLPPFLTPDDRLDVDLALDNVDGPRGEYRIGVTAEGQVTLVGNTPIVANLAEREQRTQGISIQAHDPGAGAIVVSVQGPTGISFQRRFDLPVQDPGPAMVRRAVATVKPNGELALDPALLDGLRPDSIVLSIAVGATTPIDLDGIARDLAESDFGPTEQRVSAATRPLVAGASIPIGRILARQHADGGFGAWRTGESDPWLSAYAMDFLGRAKAAGAAVPEGAYRSGLDYLARRADPSPGRDAATDGPTQPILEAAAYANAVLAKAGRIDLASLRYFAGRFLPQLRSPLAMAWIASGFAALGDKSTAATIAARALAVTDPPVAADEFASDIRDLAAFVAMVSECGDQSAALSKIAQKISDLLAPKRQLTTQEEAWLLRAARAIPPTDDVIKLTVDGQTVQRRGVYAWSSPLGAPPRLPAIKNAADKPIRAAITATGAPVATDQHEGTGYEIQRWFFDLQGKPIEPSTLKQNDLMVVVLTGRFTGAGDPHPIVIEPLPPGWTVEAADIADPATRYPWLKDLIGTSHAGEDSRGLIAVPEIAGDRHEFRFAFVVRATARGQFALPPALIEDIGRPSLFAHSTGGRTKIDPPS